MKKQVVALFTHRRLPLILALLAMALAAPSLWIGLLVDDFVQHGLLQRAPYSVEHFGSVLSMYDFTDGDPVRYQRVFWLALIEQAAAIFANIYHLGAGDFSLESVFIPIAVAGGLALLVFLHLFQPKEPEEASEPL